MHHLVDLLGLPDVDLHGERIVAGEAQIGRAALEVTRVAAADDERGTERAEPLGDRQADSRAAAGDDGDLSFERFFGEHDENSRKCIADWGRQCGVSTEEQ